MNHLIAEISFVIVLLGFNSCNQGPEKDIQGGWVSTDNNGGILYLTKESEGYYFIDYKYDSKSTDYYAEGRYFGYYKDDKDFGSIRFIYPIQGDKKGTVIDLIYFKERDIIAFGSLGGIEFKRGLVMPSSFN